jgi:hypothetical protein
MATLLKVLNNLADIKSAGGVALRVRTQGGVRSSGREPSMLRETLEDTERYARASSRGKTPWRPMLFRRAAKGRQSARRRPGRPTLVEAGRSR